MLLLGEISSFGAENVMKDALKNVDWFWILNALFPWIIFAVVASIVVIFLRLVLEKLLSKLTAKKRLKRDIEEAKYRRMIEELAQEELYNTKNSIRYTGPKSSKNDRTKTGRK